MMRRPGAAGEAATLFVLALGSNVGDRAAHLRDAVARLRGSAGVRVERVSGIFETAPVGVEDQPRFLNAALLCRAPLSPSEMLLRAKSIEAYMGRDLAAGPRWGPRVIDVDLLFHAGGPLRAEARPGMPLELPHPRWQSRDFVLAPVADLLDLDQLDAPREDDGHAGDAHVTGLLRHAHHLWAQRRAASPAPDVARVTPMPGAPGGVLDWRSRPLLMGILNVTPDSFSDGGAHRDVAAAVAAARALAAEGAAIVDVGGQSTRPGAARLPADAEAARVIPVIRAIRACPDLSGLLLSVDTFHAAVATAAVHAGASLVNDVSAGALDPAMLPAVAATGAPFVAMHMRGDPTTMQHPSHTAYPDVVADVARELSSAVARAWDAGIEPWRVVLDPGLGFAKGAQDNVRLLREAGAMRARMAWGTMRHAPLLLGPSRKGFLGEVAHRADPRDRDVATAAAVVAGYVGGGDCFRVHAVGPCRDALRVAQATWPRWGGLYGAGVEGRERERDRAEGGGGGPGDEAGRGHLRRTTGPDGQGLRLAALLDWGCHLTPAQGTLARRGQQRLCLQSPLAGPTGATAPGLLRGRGSAGSDVLSKALSSSKRAH